MPLSKGRSGNGRKAAEDGKGKEFKSMIPSGLQETVKTLREPYRKAILRTATLPSRNKLRDLSQLIVGPRRSGKTTEALAYAKVLAEAGLVAPKEPIVARDEGGRSREDWIALFKSAEGGVLIIDNIHDQLQGLEARPVGDLVMQALDESKCVVVMTGDDDKMNEFLEECRPELRARMPKAIATDRPLTPEEVKEREDRRLKREADLQANERARSASTWQQLAADVTLRTAIKPMKSVTLVRKQDVVT